MTQQQAKKTHEEQQEILQTVALLNQSRERTKGLIRAHKREHLCHGKCELAAKGRGVIKDINAEIYQIGKASGIIA